MAAFDQADMTARLIELLPQVWFSDEAKADGGNLFAVMSAPAEGDAYIYTLIQTLKANSRILTTQDVGVLSLASQDFFGNALPPLANEAANAYRARILARLFLPGGTRAGISQAVKNLTGQAPTLIEPWNPNDCGAYDIGFMGYDVAGAYGDYNLPWTGYVRVQRPASVVSGGHPYAFAYDTGISGYDDNTSVIPDLQPLQTIPDSAIVKAVQDAKPIGTTVYVQLS